MKRFRLVVAGWVMLAGALSLGPGTSLAASARPWAKVMPHTVKMGTKATIVGTHFPAKAFIDFILAVHESSRSPWKQFIPKLVKTDGKGNLKATFKMPIVPFCGPASIYAAKTGSPSSVRATFIMTGCQPPKKGKGPPPPPSKGKKKH